MAVTLRERALRFLARREHSRIELARKLAPHAESGTQLEGLLDALEARQLLSDSRYVEMRLNARGERFGNARLVHELKQQGIANGLLTAALEMAGDELPRARKVWQHRFGKQTGDTDAAERARQARFLMSRGFSGETVRRVLRGGFEED